MHPSSPLPPTLPITPNVLRIGSEIATLASVITELDYATWDCGERVCEAVRTRSVEKLRAVRAAPARRELKQSPAEREPEPPSEWPVPVVAEACVDGSREAVDVVF